MAKPINHDLTSTAATGTWETLKGAAVGAAALPLATAAAVATVGVIIGALSSGIGAALLLGAGGAMIGGVGGTAVAATIGLPLTGAAAAIGGLLGLGNGAGKVGKETAAYMAKAGVHEQQMQQAQMVAANAGLQQGYQAGFQEGQQYAVQQIQQELQQQAMQEQQKTEKHGSQQELPADGHVAREMQRRGGQHHASKADALAHQKEQASQAGHQVG